MVDTEEKPGLSEAEQKEIERRINAFTVEQQRAWLKPILRTQEAENTYYFDSCKVRDANLPHRIMFESVGLTLNASDNEGAFPVVWPGYCAWQASVAYRAKHPQSPLMPTDDWNMWLQGRAGVTLEKALANVGVLPREKVTTALQKGGYSLHLFARCTDSEMELFKTLFSMAPMFRRH